MPGQDHDNDGDYDQFDQIHQTVIDNPESALGEGQEIIANAILENALHEFLQDVAELFDDNPNNDSFQDGGLGAGDEVPEMSYWPDGPGGGLPVVLTFDNVTYSFVGGNFSIIEFGGGGPGGGGGDPFGV